MNKITILRELVRKELEARGLFEKIETSDVQEILIPEANETTFGLESLINSSYDIESFSEKAVKELTKEDYKLLLKTENFENRPLPDTYYKAQKSAKFFVQAHIRGIRPEEYNNYKEGKTPLWRTFIEHSIHVDWRALFDKKLLQFVLVEDSLDSYLRVMKGVTDPKTQNVAKGLVIIKPSAEPKFTMKEKKELVLKENDAEKIGKYILEKLSYWIEPGDVGSTAYTYAYLGTILMGTAESGVMRPDFKEIFCKPDTEMPDKNKEFFNGRFIWKAFKEPRPLWWVWQAIKTPYPANSWCECDQGNYVLHPAEQLNKFKKEDYDEWNNRKDKC